MGMIGFLIGTALLLFQFALLARLVLDWVGALARGGGPTWTSQARRLTHAVTEPVIAPVRRVLRLFLAEAALLGLAGGMIGGAVGIFLSIGLGKAVFGVAARPRLIVYPIAVALTIIVAILSAYPLRRLASIRPASVFRGEA